MHARACCAWCVQACPRSRACHTWYMQGCPCLRPQPVHVCVCVCVQACACIPCLEHARMPLLAASACARVCVCVQACACMPCLERARILLLAASACACVCVCMCVHAMPKTCKDPTACSLSLCAGLSLPLMQPAVSVAQGSKAHLYDRLKYVCHRGTVNCTLNRTCHQGTVNCTLKRTCHQGTANCTLKRTCHQGTANCTLKRACHQGTIDCTLKRTCHQCTVQGHQGTCKLCGSKRSSAQIALLSRGLLGPLWSCAQTTAAI